jgi:hypothetical protein
MVVIQQVLVKQPQEVEQVLGLQLQDPMVVQVVEELIQVELVEMELLVKDTMVVQVVHLLLIM